MGRVKVFFKGLPNYRFNSDFDDKFSYLFYDKVMNLFKESKFRDFQFFTFSNFTIENSYLFENGFLSKDGIVSFIISSVDDVFLRTLISAFVMGESLIFFDNELKLIKLEFITSPDFKSGKGSFYYNFTNFIK